MSLSIISNEVTEQECYNDYMINLENIIKCSNIKIKEFQLPKNNSENKNNSLREKVKTIWTD